IEASLILNSLNRLLTQAVKKGGWNCSLQLNKRILGNLYSWLYKIIENNPMSILDQNPTAMTTMDAVEIGQGATLQLINLNLMDAGRWKGKWHVTDSNLRRINYISKENRIPALQYQQYMKCLGIFPKGDQAFNSMTRQNPMGVQTYYYNDSA
ncbi:MAG: hypothetical protein EZS28_013015, partial [Streblomastix strix]